MFKQRFFICVLPFALTAYLSAAHAAPSCAESAKDGVTSALSIAGETAAIRSKIETPEADLRASIEELKARFLKPPSETWRVVTTQGRLLCDALTAAMSRFQSRSYPFSYISEGVVPRIRIWAKTADEETTRTVEQWMNRYEAYPMNRRLLIERTVFVRAESELLRKILQRPAADFPIEAKIATYIRHGLQTETVIFHSKSDVQKELNRLKKSEVLRFDSILGQYFKNGWFLRGRDYEQAHLEAQLKIILSELQRNNLALKDPDLRAKMIQKTQALLGNPELLSTTGARYVESRRAFTDELRFFSGKRELSVAATTLLEDGIWRNDLFDLGVDSERIGPISRFLRTTLVHSPKILMAAGFLAYAPTLKYEAKILLARETLMHEIAELPQKQYEEKSYELLKVIYGTHVVDGQPVLNADSAKAITHLRELRTAHLKDLHEEKISEQNFAMALDGPTKVTPLTVLEFKNLMEEPSDAFAASARSLVAKKVPEAERAALYRRLAESYIDIQQSPLREGQSPEQSHHENRRLSSDELVDTFAAFVTGGGDEKKE